MSGVVGRIAPEDRASGFELSLTDLDKLFSFSVPQFPQLSCEAPVISKEVFNGTGRHWAVEEPGPVERKGAEASSWLSGVSKLPSLASALLWHPAGAKALAWHRMGAKLPDSWVRQFREILRGKADLLGVPTSPLALFPWCLPVGGMHP